MINDDACYQKQNKRINQIGLSSIIFSVVVGFFVFGFADNIDFTNSEEAAPATLENNEYFTEENQKQNQNIRSKLEIELDTKSKPEVKNTQMSSIHQNFEILEPPPLENPPRHLSERENESSKPHSTVFVLEAKGYAYEVTKRLSEPAQLQLTMAPQNKDLTEFDVSKTKLIARGVIPVVSGSAEITGKKITIDFSDPDSWRPDVVLTGTLDKKISEINSGEIKVIFEDQLLFLTEDDRIPTHLNLDGRLVVH